MILAQVIIDLLRVGLVVGLVAMLIALYRLGRVSRRAVLRRERRGLGEVVADVVLGVAALVSIGVLVALFTCGRESGMPNPATPGFLEVTEGADDPICGPVDPRKGPVLVEVVHSEDKRAWIVGAASEFMRRCPHIQLHLSAIDDLAAADAILRGDRRPTMWAPLDELSLGYLVDRWAAQSDAVVLRSDERWPLLATPLVLLLWEDRLRALTTIREASRDDAGFWVEVPCPQVPLQAAAPLLEADMVPGGWREWYESRFPPPPPPPRAKKARTAEVVALPEDPQVAALKGWGRVEFASASPAHSTAGAAVLSLMALEYLRAMHPGDAAGFATLERDAGELGAWLRRCQAGLEDPEVSVRGLTELLIDVGPAHFDGVFTYEHLAVPLLQQLDAPELPELRVVYPQPTLVARHPAVLLWPDDPSRTAAHAAARSWLEFLQSDAVQRAAVRHGLRPARLADPVGSLDLIANPLRELRRFGIETDPALVEAQRPDGRSLHALLELWQAATGRG